MANKKLEAEFQAAYEKANQTTQVLPIDVMLQLYAYYKQATVQDGTATPLQDERDVRNAFKMNALLQVKGMSKTQAKQEYINLVNEHIQD